MRHFMLAVLIALVGCAGNATSALPSVTRSIPAARSNQGQTHVYVADAGAKAIVTYVAGNQAPIATENTPSAPFDVAEDSSGNLFVSYTFANQIVEYAPGFSGTMRTLSVAQPNAIVTDVHGNLYAADMADEDVEVFRPGAQSPSQIIHPIGRVYVYGGLAVKDDAIYVDVSNQGSGGIVERCPLAGADRWPCRFTSAGGAYPGGIAFDAAGEFVVGGAGTFIWFAPPKMKQLRAQYLGVGNAIRGMRSYDGTVYAAVQEKCGDALPAVTADGHAWALSLVHMSCAGPRVIAIAPDGSETAYTGLQSPLGVAVGL